jgi:hypothetical protein
MTIDDKRSATGVNGWVSVLRTTVTRCAAIAVLAAAALGSVAAAATAINAGLEAVYAPASPAVGNAVTQGAPACVLLTTVQARKGNDTPLGEPMPLATYRRSLGAWDLDCAPLNVP